MTRKGMAKIKKTNCLDRENENFIVLDFYSFPVKDDLDKRSVAFNIFI